MSRAGDNPSASMAFTIIIYLTALVFQKCRYEREMVILESKWIKILGKCSAVAGRSKLVINLFSQKGGAPLRAECMNVFQAMLPTNAIKAGLNVSQVVTAWSDKIASLKDSGHDWITATQQYTTTNV